MYNGSDRLKKRIVSVGMIALILAVMLFSAFFIAAEADHDCTGEDCPICAIIYQCEHTLRNVGNAAASQSVVLLIAISFLLLTSICETGAAQKTLISQKVRMDN